MKLKTATLDAQAEGVAGNRPTERDRWSIDMGVRMAGGGDRKVRLPATGAGNRGIDCDEEQEADGGHMAEDKGRGNS